jgi:hypothetical protein
MVELHKLHRNSPAVTERERERETERERGKEMCTTLLTMPLGASLLAPANCNAV